MEFLRQLFSSGDFRPHGYCYLWNPGLVWLHVVSDLLIALAYFTIPVMLIWFVRKRRDLPFSWMFGLFGTFIVACGSTHLMEVWNLWHANYWLAGILKAITAAACVPTAILLARLIPQALDLPSSSQWIKANAALEAEVRERRALELGLRTSESNFREQAELLDLSYDAIFIRSLDGKLLYWNRGAERMYGWPREEVRGRVVHELLQPRYPRPLEEIEAELIEKGYWEGELVHRRKDGREITVSSRWALRNSADKPVSILESNRDITSRKHEEDKFRNVLESAPDAMVIVDQKGRIQIVNSQTEKLFGYLRNELLGQSVEILVPERFRRNHPDHRERFFDASRRRPMGARPGLYGRRRDGTEVPVEISLSPLETEEGILILSSIRDVTERRQTEEQIRKLNSELSRKVSDLGALNKELEAFSYSVSHDLRAPLRHIDGFARILKEEHAAGLSPDSLRYLDRVLEAANNMGHLVDDMLNLSRIGRKDLALRCTKLDELVREVREELTAEAEHRDIAWRIEPLPEADCDPGLLKLVFVNLLSNAVKFTRSREHAVIEIGARQADGVTTYSVRDNGVGFDPKYADKLFGVFQRLHRQEDFEGTGVGLAIVQRVIQKHGGKVWAESQLDRGATFLFTLGPQHDFEAADSTGKVEHAGF